MNTSLKSKLHVKLKSVLTKSRSAIKTTSRRLKVALIGLLMICVSLISGCQSASIQPEQPVLTVDASLMVEPNLTKQLVDALSVSPSEETSK